MLELLVKQCNYWNGYGSREITTNCYVDIPKVVKNNRKYRIYKELNMDLIQIPVLY